MTLRPAGDQALVDLAGYAVAVAVAWAIARAWRRTVPGG